MERAEERLLLREARKRVHPPGLVPPGADEGATAGRATQVLTNDEDSEVLKGFPVSPGTVVGVASLVIDAQHFSEMMPNTILVCPMTSPAWTQLFAHATGLVTVRRHDIAGIWVAFLQERQQCRGAQDMGSILAHGSIVAREYGIPAVLGKTRPLLPVLTCR